MSDTGKRYQKYIDTFRDYYKLKNEYDQKLRNKKKRIKKLKLSLPEKIKQINEFKQNRKCIKCRKNGGTIFTEVDGILKAECGNEKKCNLHIELQKPVYYFLPEKLDAISQHIEKIKQEITEFKLDLLFGLQNEEVVLNEFKTLKNELIKTIEEKKIFQNIYDNKNKIIEIKVGTDEQEDVLIKDYLNDLHQNLNQSISELKRNITEYKKTNSEALLEDTIQIYKDTLIPLQDKIRELKYQVTYISETKQLGGGGKKDEQVKLMSIYHLIPTKVTVENKIVWNDSFKIIANKK